MREPERVGLAVAVAPQCCRSHQPLGSQCGSGGLMTYCVHGSQNGRRAQLPTGLLHQCFMLVVHPYSLPPPHRVPGSFMPPSLSLFRPQACQGDARCPAHHPLQATMLSEMRRVRLPTTPPTHRPPCRPLRCGKCGACAPAAAAPPAWGSCCTSSSSRRASPVTRTRVSGSWEWGGEYWAKRVGLEGMTTYEDPFVVGTDAVSLTGPTRSRAAAGRGTLL